MVVNNKQAECVSQIIDDNNLSNHNISNSEQPTGVSESKIQENVDVLPVREEETDNEISNLDLLWDSDNDNSNKITDTTEHFQNVNNCQTNLCSQGSKLLGQTSNVDLKSSLTSSEECKKENEDMDFDNFIWKSEKSNVKENTNGFIKKEVQEDNILNCKKRSSPNKDDHEIECLAKKPKLLLNDNSVLISNQMPLGLVHMPANIPFNDVPSQYSIPIEDALNLTAEERIAFAERRKIEKETINNENLMAARQGRLHLSNARFNQGVVINPPPITPQSMVAFTPGGQRYEVDLNEGRPTYFKSEYNRMQYDDATVINHLKMMSNVQDGSYLPKILNDQIERYHIAEQRYVERLMSGCVKSISENCKREEASPENGKVDNMENDVENDNVLKVENFEDSIVKAENVEVDWGTVKADNIEVDNVENDNEGVSTQGHNSDNVENDNEDVSTKGHNSDSDNDDNDDDDDSDSDSGSTDSSVGDMDEDMAFLDMELILLQFHRDVTLTIFDRPLECLRQLQHILSLDLQPLMFKKNPQLVEIAKKLMNQTEFPDIQIAATDFYDKIKSLFEVPNGVEFEEFFQLQVAELRERGVQSIFQTVLLTNELTNAAEPFRLNCLGLWSIPPFENENTLENDIEFIANDEGEFIYTSEDEDESLEMLSQYTDDDDDYDDDDDDEEEEESFQFFGPNEE